jgi:hypothetical protein
VTRLAATLLVSTAACLVCLWACTSSNLVGTPDGGDDAAGKDGGFDSDSGEGTTDVRSNNGECKAAGGQCLIGNVICAVPGLQSCGPITPAGQYCCLSNTADCGQPAAVAYACPATLDGGASCKGSAPVPIGAPNAQALESARDDDASYREGCKATFPACNNGRVPYCTCVSQLLEPSGTWSCVF